MNGNTERDFTNINDMEIVSLQWYDGRYGYMGENCPVILVCFENGDVVLLTDINDDEPIRFNVGMNIKFAVWNHKASVIAIGAERKEKTGDKISILFYDVTGKVMFCNCFYSLVLTFFFGS